MRASREMEGEVETFRCGPAARWLPRVLGATLLATLTLAAYRMDPHGLLPGSAWLRRSVVLAGGLVALWIVRKGGETRIATGIGEEGLLLSCGPRSRTLPYDRISRLGYAAPFAATRNWLPAMLLWDRDRNCWRILSLLQGGDRMLRTLLEKAGREDLAIWAETLKLEQRMAASGRRIMIGYMVSGLVLAAGLLYYFHE